MKYINNCKEGLDLKNIGLFLICQVMWALGGLRNMISERGVIGSELPGKCLLVSIFLIEKQFDFGKNISIT